MEYAEQQETNLSLEVFLSYLNSTNKNLAYIENHDTLPPLFWAVTQSVYAHKS